MFDPWFHRLAREIGKKKKHCNTWFIGLASEVGPREEKRELLQTLASWAGKRDRKICNMATTYSGQLLFQQRSSNVMAHAKNLSTAALAKGNADFALSNHTVLESCRLLQPNPPVTYHSVRTKVRVYYRPSAWKRYNKHNIEKRLTTPGGLEMLWRKTLKGRHQLAAYERILPASMTTDSKILPKHHFKYRAHPLTKHRLPKPGLF